MTGSKICTKCKEDKILSDYSKSGKYFKSDCKKCVAKRVNEYRLKNYDLIKSKKKKYWEDNKHRFIENRKEYNAKYSTEKIDSKRKSSREWAKRNRSKHREYCNKRYAENVQYNISTRVRRRIGTALFKRRVNLINKERTIKILGCSFSEYEKYIESLFTEGMNWDRYLAGEIQIDHIVPVSLFDLQDENQLLKCFNYKNTQPLWTKDNLEKHNKHEKYV